MVLLASNRGWCISIVTLLVSSIAWITLQNERRFLRAWRTETQKQSEKGFSHADIEDNFVTSSGGKSRSPVRSTDANKIPSSTQFLPWTKNQDAATTTANQEEEQYKASTIEQYLIDHSFDEELGHDKPYAKACRLWDKGDPAYSEIHNELYQYLEQLENYENMVQNFQRLDPSQLVGNKKSILAEIMEQYQQTSSSTSWSAWEEARKEVCSSLRLHPQGILGLFPYRNNNTISNGTTLSTLLSKSTTSGFIEPLVPPMRHPRFCIEGGSKIMDMSYMVHDFEEMCLRLKPNSKMIFIDMGAALDFHGTSDTIPAGFILNRYRKFGFFFDHIYAFEAAPKDPNHVYQQVPNHLVPAYHWINVPVKDDKSGSYLNPLRMILNEFNEDDLIVVKLDIDTPHLEHSLVYQLFEDEQVEPSDTNKNNNDSATTTVSYSRLIDHFYFEHHVCIQELRGAWIPCNGTLADTLLLFQQLRKKGIASHYWP